MDRPTLRQLEMLVEVARIGTFRGAARSLGLSQVAVSDHIRQLEARLGCALFVRTAGSKPALSPAGVAVLEHGRNVLFACDSLIAAAKSASDGEGADAEHRPGRVSLPVTEEAAAPSPRGANPELGADSPERSSADRAPIEPIADAAVPIIISGHPSLLSRFQSELAAAEDAFPDRPISLDFGSFTAADALLGLAEGRSQIALFYAAGGTDDLSDTAYLWSENWSLFARADHPLVQGGDIDARHCVDLPIIMPDPSGPLRAIYEHGLASAGLWPLPTVLETDDYAAILEELSFGEAAFAAFGATAAQFGARPGLRRLSLTTLLRPVEVRLAVARSAADDPTVQALAGILR